ncbi:hypothetical protein [Wolbachia endosymbiont (group A) of Paraperithous gnathaulax]|uniref:hypothetical protein n=1 Tax=Wolbachia endosymbiont (group A) of Paraperithous gnathaulax TaxID=3066212 RepID=UPI0033402777
MTVVRLAVIQVADTGSFMTAVPLWCHSSVLIPIPITRQTDGQRWKKSHNEVSKIVEV